MNPLPPSESSDVSSSDDEYIPLKDTGVFLPTPGTVKSPPLQAMNHRDLSRIVKPASKPPETWPPVVNRSAFIALVVGQASINCARERMFPYGSGNQLSSLNKPQTGASATPRLITARIAKQVIKLAQKKIGNPRDLSGILGRYYGAANCAENSIGTYKWLKTFLPPGYTVSEVLTHPDLEEHQYCLIWWKEKSASGKEQWCADPVVVDAGFAAQACLFSHFYWNPAHYQNNVTPDIAKNPYFVIRTHTQPDTIEKILHGDVDDSFEETASKLDVNIINLLPPREKIKDMEPAQLERYKQNESYAEIAQSVGDGFKDFDKKMYIKSRPFADSSMVMLQNSLPELPGAPASAHALPTPPLPEPGFLLRLFGQRHIKVSEAAASILKAGETFLYRTSCRLGPHLGDYIDYRCTTGSNNDDGGHAEKTQYLSDFGADKEKGWKGVLEDGKRQVWSAELPETLITNRTTGRVDLAPYERERRRERNASFLTKQPSLLKRTMYSMMSLVSQETPMEKAMRQHKFLIIMKEDERLQGIVKNAGFKNSEDFYSIIKNPRLIRKTEPETLKTYTNVIGEIKKNITDNTLMTWFPKVPLRDLRPLRENVMGEMGAHVRHETALKQARGDGNAPFKKRETKRGKQRR